MKPKRIEIKNKYIKYIKLPNKENTFQKAPKLLVNKTKIIIYLIIFFFYTIFIILITFFLLKKKYSSNSITTKYLSNSIKTKYEFNESKIEILKLMTFNNKTLYEGAERCLTINPDEELCFYQFLCPKEVIGKKRVLIGEKHDGSYVTLDDFENVKIAYSIGIKDIIHFDKALADKGIDVYMYDHTINKLPYMNDKFHWKKIGIGGNSERSHNIQTIEDMMKENGHLNEKNMIFKMDVEGAEWNSLNDLSEDVLKQFKYLLFEYHFRKADKVLAFNVLKKIHKTHQVFYVHCSPFSHIFSSGNNRFCSAIEVSYVIRDGNKFTKDKSIYPISDFSIDHREDFNINIFKLFDFYE